MSRSVLLVLIAAACADSGGTGAPIGGPAVVPELLACRARVGNAMNFSEIALRSAQNLGTARIADRAGIERRARLHPDGRTLVFARETASADPRSRELFTATIDGSQSEVRLTQNTALDDEPCWSPTGDAVLYSSESAGSRSLWLCDPDGRNPRLFLTPEAGSTDGQADWSAATDRIVFSRRDASGRHRLWLVQGDGTGLVPFTSGGAATAAGTGDHEPAFSPDGTMVAFARRLAGTAVLAIADVATGTVTARYQTTGDVGLPRYSPRNDRIFFGLAEPAAGRKSLRLAFVPTASGDPLLVWPDERHDLVGIEMLPTMPALAVGRTPVVLDVEAAEIAVTWGSYSFGAESQLTAADNNAYEVLTRTSGLLEVAGITGTFDLPAPDPTDVLEVRIRVVARVSRIGGGTALRISVYNPSDSRSDTAVELEPTSTGWQNLEFRTSSLRHVTREGQVRFNIIGEIERGERAELQIDLVEVIAVERAAPR